jgi:hypothetical protein
MALHCRLQQRAIIYIYWVLWRTAGAIPERRKKKEKGG